jgi:hypothetical protein
MVRMVVRLALALLERERSRRARAGGREHREEARIAAAEAVGRERLAADRDVDRGVARDDLDLRAGLVEREIDLEALVELRDRVVETDLGARHESRHGDDLREDPADAAVNDAAREVDEIARVHFDRTQESARSLGIERARIEQRVELLADPQLRAGRRLLHEIELVEAALARMVVRERIDDAHSVRVERVVDVRADMLVPRQKDASVRAGLGRASAGRVGDLGIPVGAHDRRKLGGQRHGRVEDEQGALRLEARVLRGAQEHDIADGEIRSRGSDPDAALAGLHEADPCGARRLERLTVRDPQHRVARVGGLERARGLGQTRAGVAAESRLPHDRRLRREQEDRK